MTRHDTNASCVSGASPQDTPDPSTGLNLTGEQARALMAMASEHVLRFQEGLASGEYPASYIHDSRDAHEYTDGVAAALRLREDAVPRRGTDPARLLGELFGDAMTNGTLHPHPGFMAHIPSGGLVQSAVADFVASAVNRFAGVWVAAPGFQQLERNVIRWYCTMLGYGAGSFGYLTTGGSIANLMALMCARHGRPDDRPPVVYTSAETHYSVAKAARLAGITRVHTVGVRDDFTMDTAELAARVAADRADGLRPLCVVATAGTTNTGAVDDLAGIAAFCRDEDLWCHVDACFGGFFRLTRRGRTALAGIEDADSIAVDAHKSLFLPHGNSALLVRDRAGLRDTFEVPGAAPYLPGLGDGDDLADFCNHGPELSRGIRGLAAWLPLKMHGVSAFEACLDERMDLADLLARRVAAVEGVEVVQAHARFLPVVTFGMAVPETARERVNARLCDRICARGNAYLTTTDLPGYGLVVRACILHPRTDEAVVERLVEDVRLAAAELAFETGLYADAR